jgi:hypothetical protein
MKGVKGEIKKRRASDSERHLPSPALRARDMLGLSSMQPVTDVLFLVSETSPSPDKKRLKLPNDTHLPSSFLPNDYSQKNKKKESKRVEKEQARMMKKEAKQKERLQIAERKRMRGECCRC